MKLAFELWKKSNIEPQLEKCFDYNFKIYDCWVFYCF